MAYVTSDRVSGLNPLAWLSNVMANVAQNRAQRGVYLETLHELETMSDRDLADIGISRVQIKDIAYEAAYGK